MRPKQLTLPGLADLGSELEGPKLKLKIRPVLDGGVVKGLAMVGIASAITLYPVRIMEGQRGLFAAMPQRQEKSGQWKDVIYPVSREAREYLQRHWVEGGERRMADMVLVTDAYKERFLEAVTKEYQRIAAEKAAVEIKKESM